MELKKYSKDDSIEMKGYRKKKQIQTFFPGENKTYVVFVCQEVLSGNL